MQEVCDQRPLVSTVGHVISATPGIHFPEARYYIRRVRLAKNSPLVPSLQNAGYVVEPAESDPSSLVVEIPVDVGEGVRTLRNVSMWEQLMLAAFLQEHWADNQARCLNSTRPGYSYMG